LDSSHKLFFPEEVSPNNNRWRKKTKHIPGIEMEQKTKLFFLPLDLAFCPFIFNSWKISEAEICFFFKDCVSSAVAFFECSLAVPVKLFVQTFFGRERSRNCLSISYRVHFVKKTREMMRTVQEIKKLSAMLGD
jgi:hypothetical protein